MCVQDGALEARARNASDEMNLESSLFSID